MAIEIVERVEVEIPVEVPTEDITALLSRPPTCVVPGCAFRPIEDCHYCDGGVCLLHAFVLPHWCLFHFCACPTCYAKYKQP